MHKMCGGTRETLVAVGPAANQKVLADWISPIVIVYTCVCTRAPHVRMGGGTGMCMRRARRAYALRVGGWVYVRAFRVRVGDRVRAR